MAKPWILNLLENVGIMPTTVSPIPETPVYQGISPLPEDAQAKWQERSVNATGDALRSGIPLLQLLRGAARRSAPAQAVLDYKDLLGVGAQAGLSQIAQKPIQIMPEQKVAEYGFNGIGERNKVAAKGAVQTLNALMTILTPNAIAHNPIGYAAGGLATEGAVQGIEKLVKNPQKQSVLKTVAQIGVPLAVSIITKKGLKIDSKGRYHAGDGKYIAPPEQQVKPQKEVQWIGGEQGPLKINEMWKK